MIPDEPLERFHPVVAEWFKRRFPEGPTDAQALGWAEISEGHDTLIAAPTGSGKTLAAFLVAIDRCLRRPERTGTSVIYVSPLRALTVDVAKNLTEPLEEIAELGRELGLPLPDIRVAVRNGDTSAAKRVALIRDRPEIVVTTPESLYLLATSQRGRDLLSNVDTVIIDEIHALARDKRGSHLALTLERLDRIVATAAPTTSKRPIRIGCSATQRPIEAIARLLVGSGKDRDTKDGRPLCAIVDVGHKRTLDTAIVLGFDELGAVTTTDQLDEVVSMLAHEIRTHRTTLVFVNTRRMAERIAHLLSQDLGEERIVAHHGSLSLERRLRVESKLRSGELDAVVATASLELGIDIGPIDLVCQIGSPRAIATFLQRVGRAEHQRNGIPKGRLYPLTRDELVECVALLGAVEANVLDSVVIPRAPLDVLAQQIVAECAGSGEDGIEEAELHALVRSAAPFEGITDEELESVVTLVSDGVITGRGARGAYIQRDHVHRILRARRGARLTALTSGGAIPDLANFSVIAEPDGFVVGSVDEDFATEAMAGDVFLLGTMAWRIRRVEQGVVRVVDAAGAPPTIPFWIGEAPARTDELSQACSHLRQLVVDHFDDGPAEVTRAVIAWSGVSHRVADEVVAYLFAAHQQLGCLPTRTHVVLERFFDETGGMQLVVHAPYGARINRGLGLALRKRFCRNFDFELQAAANDDAIVLSLGPQHSFGLEEVSRYLAPTTVRDVVIQAVLPTPIFSSRWRWNLGRSLVSPRFRGARRLPPAIQRMEADDLMAAIFPALAACQENVSGPIEIPDHPIVRQTLDDCLFEAIDIEGLIDLVGNWRSGNVSAIYADTAEPSLLSHEILNGRPYTFLDDAPLEERRTRAVALRRGVPIEAHDLTVMDPVAIAEVIDQVTLHPRDAEELHDVLCSLIVLDATPKWQAHFDRLVASGRAMTIHHGSAVLWCATERRAQVESLFHDAHFEPDYAIPPQLDTEETIDELAAAAIVMRGFLDCLGPSTVEDLCARTHLERRVIEPALRTLEHEGSALGVLEGSWCSRRIALRIRALHTERNRARAAPVEMRDFMRFLLEWQHVSPGFQLAGEAGLASVLGQLQGFEAAVGSWERAILPSRISRYSPQLLDALCANGLITFARLSSLARTSNDEDAARRTYATPSRATPLSFLRRDDLGWLLDALGSSVLDQVPHVGATSEVLEVLSDKGALFFTDLCSSTGRLPTEIADALWDAMSRGLISADGFQAVRALLAGRYRQAVPAHRAGMHRRGLRPVGPRAIPPAVGGGRWSLLKSESGERFDGDELAETLAAQLLERWGVVFRELVAREHTSVPWRELLWAFRRLEARGLVRGGRFVAGVGGEQFALSEAADALRTIAARPREGVAVQLSASDPLNLTGVLFPGPRVPAVARRVVTYIDGVPSDPRTFVPSPKEGVVAS